MDKRIIRFIVYAITMCIIYAVINYLSQRDDTVKTLGQDESHYVVKVPDALKYVYFAMFILGIIMFFVFLFFKLKGNPTATNGHLRLALIVTAIGLLVMVIASRWHLSVNGNQMGLYRLFHKSVKFEISEIEKVEVGSKGQIMIYKDGKKLVTVDALSDNYSRFKKTLIQNGKMN